MRIVNTLFFATSFGIVFLFIKLATLFAYLVRFKHWNTSKEVKRVLYLSAFFPENAGYQYRALKWAEKLEGKGLQATIVYATSKPAYDHYIDHANPDFLIKYMLKRIGQLFLTSRHDVVIVRRELLLYNEYGNLFLEKFLHAIHPNIILDFDDDIGASKREPREISTFGTLMMEHPAKFNGSLKLYNRFIVGSPYLKEMVLKVQPNLGDKDIIVIPTCVDYAIHPPKIYEADEFIHFGWIGNTGNQKLLTPIITALNEVSKKQPLKLLVISGKPYEPTAEFETINIPWSLSTEIEHLSQIDIGLMPLDDNAISRGKCGFKLIQYMGLGIVSIATALTINKEIVEDGVSGFLVGEGEDWQAVIEKILAQRDRYPEIGAQARKRIADKYSFEANYNRYHEFITA